MKFGILALTITAFLATLSVASAQSRYVSYSSGYGYGSGYGDYYTGGYGYDRAGGASYGGM